MEYYAHSLEDAPATRWQALKEHLEQTASRAEGNAFKFGGQNIAFIAGILHDIGKYSREYQSKLRGKSISVDHSSAGAQVSKELYTEVVWKIVSYVVTGHHGGILDYGNPASQLSTVFRRLSKEICDYSAYENEIDPTTFPDPTIPITPFPHQVGFSVAFFIKMVHSSLVDADFLDTEFFYQGKERQTEKPDYASALSRLTERLNPYTTLPTNASDIARNRQQILRRCLESSTKAQGFYSLTVPTGGGKTLSSLAFALKHALRHGLERIIYVLPYTTIIEQNAEVVRELVGDKHLLEHHSNFEFSLDSEQKQDENSVMRMKLATENWDIPVVFTTNVQFFESIFGNRTSTSRKLHNMAKSVVILDEAQMLPVPYLKPCLLSLHELVRNYHSTVLLCTATQPYLFDVTKEMLKAEEDELNVTELMDSPEELYRQFKRVEIVQRGDLDDFQLVEELQERSQVLCIVNTRRHAKELYNMLQGDPQVYHLSTLMCPAHRKKVIGCIKEQLTSDSLSIAIKPVKVVSTQLIEAGVDIDFPMVYRSMAGLDSIVQSAGRCNREGRQQSGQVMVFDSTSEYAKTKGYLARTAVYARQILRKYRDPLSLEAIKNYFDLVYSSEDLDKHEIIQECFSDGRTFEFKFATAAENFKLISDDMYAIVIPYDDKAVTLLDTASHSKYLSREVRRALQAYTVSVYEYEFRRLLEYGAIRPIDETLFALEQPDLYDDNTGLDVTYEPSGEAIFA